MDLKLTWGDFNQACKALAANIPKQFGGWLPAQGIYGIPTGGCFVAIPLAVILGSHVLDAPEPECLVVDDLTDSGKTMERYANYRRAALYRKVSSPNSVLAMGELEGWITFPWEVDHPGTKHGEGPTDAVVRLLEYIGEDPKRPGLVGTPDRVTRALREMTAGMHEDPKEILARCFDEAYDEVVVVRGIPFASMCEHHMLPFTGTVDIGYLPHKKVVGLSKLARLVECFSRRLQIQEKMTREIANAIETYLQAQGVAVIVRASHSCMACRGVRKPGAEMVTSTMLGVFRDKPEARAEFLALCK